MWGRRKEVQICPRLKTKSNPFEVRNYFCILSSLSSNPFKLMKKMNIFRKWTVSFKTQCEWHALFIVWNCRQTQTTHLYCCVIWFQCRARRWRWPSVGPLWGRWWPSSSSSPRVCARSSASTPSVTRTATWCSTTPAWASDNSVRHLLRPGGS